MIALDCTRCGEVLEVDDAFSGGVCRCGRCGTIQTVPASRRQTRPAAIGSVGFADEPDPSATSRTLYARLTPEPSAGLGTGLDELANVVASSGLIGSGLAYQRSGTHRRNPASSPRGVPDSSHLSRGSARSASDLSTGRRRKAAVAAGAGVAVASIVIGGLWVGWWGRQSSQSPAAWNAPPPAADRSSTVTPIATPVTPAGSSTQETSATPTFVGVPIEGRTVAYVIDRGESNREYFGQVIEATLRSIATLGPAGRFRVMFWDEIDAAPARFDTPDRFRQADSGHLAATRRALENVWAGGQTSGAGALRRAAAGRPDVILLVTAKQDWQLDANDVDDLLAASGDLSAASGDRSPRIDVISLGGESKSLATLAARSGGAARTLHRADLMP